MRRPLLVTVLVTVLCTFGRGVAPAGASSCSDPSSGHVAVVIDFGTLTGAPDGVFTDCVTVGPQATGMTALRAATGNRLGFDASEKVCSILGYPSAPDPRNCSTPVDGRIRYWAYFHGTSNGWEYSSSGAASQRAVPDVVEGWRFLDVPATGGSTGIEPPRDVAGRGPMNLWTSTCAPAAAPTEPTPPGTGGPVSGPAVVPNPSATSTATPSGGSGADTSATTAAPATTTASPPTTLGYGALQGLKSDHKARAITRSQVRALTSKPATQTSPFVIGGWILAGLALVAVAMSAAVVRARRRLNQP